MQTSGESSQVKHVKKYNLFHERQYCVISVKATVLQLLDVLESWTNT